MRRIAVINQKGGVGKTTTCANLGAALALAGQRVVLVDMDPQANLSMHLGQELFSQDPSTYTILVGQTPFDAALRPTTVSGLSVVPAHIDLSGAELELASAIGRETLLRDALDEWERSALERTGSPPADFLLLDCPPSLGLLSVNALAAAREVLIAVQTEFFALQGMSKLVEVVQLLRRRLNPDLRIRGILPCLYDNRLRLAREVLAEVRRYFPGQVFRTSIRTNVKLAEAPSHGLTIFEYDPTCSGATDHASLAEEILAQGSSTPPSGASPPRDARDPSEDAPRAGAFEERIAEMARGERRATLRPQPPRPGPREVETPESGTSAPAEETLLPTTSQEGCIDPPGRPPQDGGDMRPLRYPVGGARAPMAQARLHAPSSTMVGTGTVAVEEDSAPTEIGTSAPFTVQIDEIVVTGGDPGTRPVSPAKGAESVPIANPGEGCDPSKGEIHALSRDFEAPLASETASRPCPATDPAPPSGAEDEPSNQALLTGERDVELATVEVPRPGRPDAAAAGTAPGIPEPVERMLSEDVVALGEDRGLPKADEPLALESDEPSGQVPPTAEEDSPPTADLEDPPQVEAATDPEPAPPEEVPASEPIVELRPEPPPRPRLPWNFAGYAGEDRPRMAGPLGPRTS